MGSNVLRQTFADFHAAFKLVLAIFSSERSDDHYHQLKVCRIEGEIENGLIQVISLVTSIEES